MSAPGVRELLRRLGGALANKPVDNLSAEEMDEVFTALLDGAGTDAQVSLLFALIRAKGPTSDELLGCARAARRRVHFPALPPDTVVVTTSRVGKRVHPPTFLAAAAAVAATGLPVLLHATPGIPGEGVTLHDLWQRAVGPPSPDAADAATMLAEHGLAMWSPAHADAGWERLLRLEDETGMRSLLDVVLKLLVPEGAPVMTAARPGPVLGMAADAIAGLGHEEALIVQGVEGSVDPFVAQSSRGMRLLGGMTVPLRLQPEDFALFLDREPSGQHESRLEAGALATCHALLGADGPERTTAALGAALLLSLHHRDRPLAECLGMAAEALESGAAEARAREIGWSPG